MRGTGSGERGAPRRPPEKGDVTGTWSGCCGTRPVSSRSAACRRRLLCSGHRAFKASLFRRHMPLSECPTAPPPPRALVRAHGTTPTTRDRSPPRRPGLRRTCEVPLTREAAHSLVRGSDTHIFGAVIIRSSSGSMCFSSKGPRAGPIRKDRLHSRGSPLAPPSARSRWNPPTPSLRLSAQAVPGRWVVCSFPETRT